LLIGGGVHNTGKISRTGVSEKKERTGRKKSLCKKLMLARWEKEGYFKKGGERNKKEGSSKENEQQKNVTLSPNVRLQRGGSAKGQRERCRSEKSRSLKGKR